MANTEFVTRSNYFKVRDEGEFRKFIGNYSGEEQEGFVNVFTNIGDDGITRFAFGFYGSLCMCADREPADYDEFCQKLKSHIADGDAAVITEISYEKLNFAIGQVIIVTNKEVEIFDTYYFAKQVTRDLLGNPDWDTRMDY